MGRNIQLNIRYHFLYSMGRFTWHSWICYMDELQNRCYLCT